MSSGAAIVAGLSPAAWFRFNLGITGNPVSQWNDASGNARHLKQVTATNQPALQGDGSILFDGIDNYMKCDAFTLNQPATFYILGRQVTWTDVDCFCDGDAGASQLIQQSGATPAIRLFAGLGVASNTNLAVNTYGVVAAVFNGASSLLQINNTTPTTGDPGAANAGGFTLGSTGTAGAPSNIQVKEVVIFAAAHDATTRAAVIGYLSRVGGL
jgi:hypothetical protein